MPVMPPGQTKQYEEDAKSVIQDGSPAAGLHFDASGNGEGENLPLAADVDTFGAVVEFQEVFLRVELQTFADACPGLEVMPAGEPPNMQPPPGVA